MFNKSLHIILAINLFISSFGLMTFEHICSKNGTTLSFFIKSEGCCAKKKVKSCSVTGCTLHKSNHGLSFEKKPCCEDKTHYKKLNLSAIELTKVILTEVQSIYYLPVAEISFNENNFNSENEKTLKLFLYKPPPLPVDNLRVLYQSFLC